jgi:hypothetical protein
LTGRLTLLFLPALVLAALAFTAAPALAAAPEKPEALLPTEVKATTATLHGVLDPLKAGGPFELNTYEFVYRQSPTECKGAGEVKTTEGLSLGGGKEEVSQGIAALTANTQYTVCLVAHNEAKTESATSSPVTFKTALPPEPPTTTSPATAITTTSATLQGVLNPGGGGEAGSYEFVYRLSATECQKINPETGQPENEFATPTTAAPAGKTAVTVLLEGLAPGAQYTFCLLSRNGAGETALGAPVTFRALAEPPTIVPKSTSSTEVTATSAKLNAQIDPGGAETTYHFEFDTSPYTTGVPHGQSTLESGVGADNANHSAVAVIQGLQPATTYHYRLVATNSQSPEGGTPGPDRSFTTQSLGVAFELPDGRAYELVSPPEKDGAEVLGIGGASRTPGGGDATQASEDGTSVTYITNAAVGATPPGNSFSSQIFSTRSTDGWSSQDIAIPHEHAIEFGGGIIEEGEEYIRFSSDLSRAVVVSPHKTLEPSLAPEVKQEVRGGQDPADLTNEEIYLRSNATNVFRAVLTAEPLPLVSFEGASPDLTHVVFTTEAGLDPEYPGVGGLFEWVGGHDKLVDVLPSGVPAGGGQLPEFGVRHVISNDGTRVVWSGPEGGLFTRDVATGTTVQVDAVQSGGGLSGGGSFLTASSDGSRVFFTDGNELTSGASEGGLYVFEPGRREGERLTDLTPGTNGVQVQSFIGADEGGTSLYFLSPAALPSAPNGQGEDAKAGASNLYLLREAPAASGSWSATFITAGAEEASGGTGGNSGNAPLVRQEMRVSPSGRYVAFMSRESLTGYDNRDAESGQPDEEVYLYDAEADKLVCASCNPTGARPIGERMPESPQTGAIDAFGTWANRWLAATIPGWTPNGSVRTTGYQPRFLSDSGRLFFNSADALVPRDVNGRTDVYQYEPAGLGSCQPPSYGQGASVVFSAAAEGCVGLISAGAGKTDSVFFDASASGDDVFFTTGDGLMPQDRDGVSDMYDAHVCTAAEPCAPPAAASPPACTTADACRTAPSPQPGIFGASGSATFAGAGNVAVTPPPKKITKKTAKCAKGKKRSHGKCLKKKKTKAKKSAHTNRRASR